MPLFQWEMFPNEFLRNSEIEHLHEYKQLLLDQHVQIVQTICKKVKIMKNMKKLAPQQTFN